MATRVAGLLTGSRKDEAQLSFASKGVKELLTAAQKLRGRVANVALAEYEGQTDADIAARKVLHSLHSRDSCRALQTTVSGYFDLVLYATDFAFDQKKDGLSGGKKLSREKAHEQYEYQQGCWPEHAGGAAGPMATGGDVTKCPYHTVLAQNIYKALQSKQTLVKGFAIRLATMHEWDGLVAVMAKARLLLPEEYCEQIANELKRKLVMSVRFHKASSKVFMKTQLEE